MFFIPGWLIAAITFPGVMLHEWAHKFFCERFHVPVFEVKYFSFRSEVAGYVKHGVPETFWQSFFIAFGPLVVNSTVAFLLACASTQTVDGTVLRWLILWVAVSAGMHAFPSDHDARFVVAAARTARENGGSLLYFVALPFVLLVFAVNPLRMLWFDYIYAVLLVISGFMFGGGKM
jgi:Putative zincin peptidase